MYNNETLEIALHETTAWSIVPWTCRLDIYIAGGMESIEKVVLVPAFKKGAWVCAVVWSFIKLNPLISVAAIIVMVMFVFKKLAMMLEPCRMGESLVYVLFVKSLIVS